MWRKALIGLVTACSLALSLASPAMAQSGGASSSQEGSKTAALPYGVAFLSTLLVMVILCMPSRKR